MTKEDTRTFPESKFTTNVLFLRKLLENVSQQDRGSSQVTGVPLWRGGGTAGLVGNKADASVGPQSWRLPTRCRKARTATPDGRATVPPSGRAAGRRRSHGLGADGHSWETDVRASAGPPCRLPQEPQAASVGLKAGLCCSRTGFPPLRPFLLAGGQEALLTCTAASVPAEGACGEGGGHCLPEPRHQQKIPAFTSWNISRPFPNQNRAQVCG